MSPSVICFFLKIILFLVFKLKNQNIANNHVIQWSTPKILGSPNLRGLSY